MNKKGAAQALGAYVIWGFFPVYWKLLQDVDALQLVCHRVVWSLVLVLVLIAVSRRTKQLGAVFSSPKTMGLAALAGVLVASNWLIYVWAVNAGMILETSLGYYINPLVSVLLGLIFLGERLRPGQWAALALAAGAVIFQTWSFGQLPWVAVSLALSFGFYGLVKKKTRLEPMVGLGMETLAMLLPALGFLFFVQSKGSGAFLNQGWGTDLLLLGTGIVTTVPLLLFAGASQKVPLWAMGLYQYITPSIQFILGVAVYGERFDATQGISFALIWLALGLFGAEGVIVARRRARAARPEASESA